MVPAFGTLPAINRNHCPQSSEPANSRLNPWIDSSDPAGSAVAKVVATIAKDGVTPAVVEQGREILRIAQFATSQKSAPVRLIGARSIETISKKASCCNRPA
jgi:hypothetical protein